MSNRTPEERINDEKLMKMLQNDMNVILTKYHELGHGLCNILINGAVKQIIHRIHPDFFEGLGYLSYRLNDYYINEHQGTHGQT